VVAEREQETREGGVFNVYMALKGISVRVEGLTLLANLVLSAPPPLHSVAADFIQAGGNIVRSLQKMLKFASSATLKSSSAQTSEAQVLEPHPIICDEDEITYQRDMNFVFTPLVTSSTSIGGIPLSAVSTASSAQVPGVCAGQVREPHPIICDEEDSVSCQRDKGSAGTHPGESSVFLGRTLLSAFSPTSSAPLSSVCARQVKDTAPLKKIFVSSAS
jgi:hypothetical protein